MTNCLEEVQFCHLPQSAFPKCVFWDINSTRCPVQLRKNSLVDQVWQMLHIISPSGNSEYTTRYKEFWEFKESRKILPLIKLEFSKLLWWRNCFCAKSTVTHPRETPCQLLTNVLPIYTPKPSSPAPGEVCSLLLLPSSTAATALKSFLQFSIKFYLRILKYVISISGEIIGKIFSYIRDRKSVNLSYFYEQAECEFFHGQLR